jgi:cystathionine gamma-synthase
VTPFDADETLLCNIGVDADPTYGAVMPPLYLSSNFSFAGFDQKRAYDYTRSGNPTRDLLASAISALECGAGAVVTSSGMAAIDLVLSLLEPGALVVAPHDGYGGTHRLLSARAGAGAIRLLEIDQSDPLAMRSALARSPALILIETPSNPLMRIVDIKAISEEARKAGALVAVDNTFLSPVLQKPLLLGADLVIHSTTKYLNGHSDVVGGAVAAADADLIERLRWWANCRGVSCAPFDAWLTLRGMRTLCVRMARQQSSAAFVARRLAEHPAVARVHYPGLADHPGHALARRQQKGFGAMLSFELAEPTNVAVFLDRLRAFTLAESLGGIESLVAHPATMTHAAMPPDVRARAGIGDRLIRISVGLESPHHLCADLEAALSGVELAPRRSGAAA